MRKRVVKQNKNAIKLRYIFIQSLKKCLQKEQLNKKKKKRKRASAKLSSLQNLPKY